MVWIPFKAEPVQFFVGKNHHRVTWTFESWILFTSKELKEIFPYPRYTPLLSVSQAHVSSLDTVFKHPTYPVVIVSWIMFCALFSGILVQKTEASLSRIRLLKHGDKYLSLKAEDDCAFFDVWPLVTGKPRSKASTAVHRHLLGRPTTLYSQFP